MPGRDRAFHRHRGRYVHVQHGNDGGQAGPARLRGIPAMIAMGRKGGSTVAAAILNALIYQAAKMQEPEQRGW